MHAVGDAAYASRAWRSLPARVTVTFRLRRDGALHAPTPPRTGRRGRPAKKGGPLPPLAQIALDSATGWEQIGARRYGKEEGLHVHLRPCLWYRALGETPVRLLLVRDRDRPSGYELALITTDLKASTAELVQRLRRPLGDRGVLRRGKAPGRRRRGRATALARRSSGPSPSSFCA